jgi:hypothetical protein
MGNRSFPEQLRFVAQTRSVLSAHSLQGLSVGAARRPRWSWHSARDTLYTTRILTEVRGWNWGYAAWRDDIYKPIPQHQLARALFCNAANAANNPDWTDPGGIGFRSYEDF